VKAAFSRYLLYGSFLRKQVHAEHMEILFLAKKYAAVELSVDCVFEAIMHKNLINYYYVKNYK
jgi:hypothetical protein